MGGASSSSNDGEGSSTIDQGDIFPHLGVQEDDEIAGGDQDLPARRTPKVDPDPEDDIDPEDIDPEADTDPEDDVDPEADPEDDEDADPEADDSQVFEVIVDGEPTEVSLNEALQGYIRQETFHRRLNKLNEFEGAVNQVANNVTEQRARYIGLIDEMLANVEALVPPEPDWDKIYAENPPEKARKLQKDYDQLKAQKAKIAADRQKAVEEQEAQLAENFQRWKKAQNAELARRFPTWSDPQKGQEVMKRDITAMAQTAKAAGFTDEEIENTHDARMIVVLNKAAAYDRMMSRKTPKPVTRAKSPVTHGAGRTRTAPKGVARNMKQLTRTGKVEDAAAVFADILNRK